MRLIFLSTFDTKVHKKTFFLMYIMINEITIPPIHILDLISHYFLNVNKNTVLTPQTFCKIIRSTLTSEDIRLIRDENRWNIEFAGEPHRVSPGAKRYEDIAPYFMRFYKSNNCYAFAMDDLRGQRQEGSLPGTISRDSRRFLVNWQSCDIPKEMVMKDSRKNHDHLEIMTSSNVGLPGTYRVQFFVDTSPGNSRRSTDFHWYREVRPPAWIAHYLRHYRSYKKIKDPKYTKHFMMEAEALLRTMKAPCGKIHPDDNLQKYHGIKTYFLQAMGSDSSNKHEDTYAIYANKAGLSNILSICGKKGRIMCNPMQAIRGYSNNIDYDKFCDHFVVKTNRGKSSN